MTPKFFAKGEDFYEWLKAHHESESELLVGIWKRGSGKGGMIWSEAVDQALCFGWIDGVGRRIDDDSYAIRFSKRRKGSNWSKINLDKMEKLLKAGKVAPASREIWEQRDPRKEKQYSFEQESVEFDDTQLKEFKANEEAWEFFQKQPPSYRRVSTWHVVSAKREETRLRRLKTLISESQAGRRIG